MLVLRGYGKVTLTSTCLEISFIKPISSKFNSDAKQANHLMLNNRLDSLASEYSISNTW